VAFPNHQMVQVLRLIQCGVGEVVNELDWLNRS
jgi:hypothetical protein